LSPNNKWFAIVNPKAGSGKGESDWPKIRLLLEEKGVDFEFRFTERKFHAVELSVWAINNSFRKLLVIGGDGTLNEVVNGLFIQKSVSPSNILIGVIGVGTGNDWQRTYSSAKGYTEKVEAIKEAKSFLQDVGVVRFFESKVQQTRYFANAAGLGFDAAVAQNTNKLKENGRRGKLLYILSLLKTLVSYQSSLISLSIDGQTIGGTIFSATLGIGKYNGGGMMPTPNAKPDDGLFDITVITNISRSGVLRNLGRLYNGSILNHPHISGFQGKEITVSSRPPVNLEADGESLGSSPFTFSIIPKCINVVVGADFENMFES